MAVPKPTAVFDQKWSELKVDLSARYSTALVTRMLSTFRFTEFPGAFDAIQPEGMDQTQRDRIRDWLRALYFAILVKEIQQGLAPVDTINSADLKSLSKADADVLRAFAYQRRMREFQDVSTPRDADLFLGTGKPAFMSDHDYDRLTTLASAIKKADLDRSRYLALITKITDLLGGIELGSNPPPQILPGEWANLKRMEQNIARAGEMEALRAKVLRQLDVINVFVNDPSVIDRLEEYEDVFARGNLLNLKKLAQQLRNSPKN